MKILFVAMKYDYGIPERGLSFEYYNFYDALRGMGHDVEYFDFYSLFLLHGRERMTALLREKVDEIKPNLMFTFLYRDEFDFAKLCKITSETKTITFNWFADDHWRFDSFSRYWASCFTFVSTTDASVVPKYHSAGYKNVLLTQWGANTRIYTKGDGRVVNDVTFVGQKYGNRARIVRRLKRRGISTDAWGGGWDVRSWHRAVRKLRLMNDGSFQKILDRTRISQSDMIAVFQSSKINLNLSTSSQPGANQIKGRNFEIPACGGFQVSEIAERLDEFFELGKEIVCYQTVDELVGKVKYYLSHESERCAIADAGYRRVLREHTYEHRFRRLFEQMGLA